MVTISNGMRQDQSDEPAKESSGTEPSQRPVKYKVVKLVVFAFYSLGMGLTFALIGPTLPALKDRMDVEYSQLSTAVSATSGGIVVGGIFGGLVLDRVRHQGIYLSLAILLRSLCTIAVPFCTNVYLLAAALFSLAFGGGMSETGVGKEIMQLYGSRGASAMHLTRFCFSLGGFIAPSVARVFIHDQEEPEQNSTDFDYEMDSSDAGISSSIEYAFFIISGVCFLSAIGILIVYLYDRSHYEMTTYRTKTGKKTCGPEETDCTVRKMCLLAIVPCYFVCSMGSNSLNKYVAAFGIESDVNLDYRQATLLTTVFWFCTAASRLAGIGLSLFFKPRFLIIGQLVVMLTSAILLIFFGFHNEYMLWIGVAMFATGQGVSWANGVAWAFQYFEPNAFMYMIFMTSGGLGSMAIDYVTGALFDTDPFYFTYVFLGITGFKAVVFVTIEIMACGLKRQKAEPDTEHTKL